ncbi:MAG TPA: hypothetical protein VFU01_04945 [Gemmatimonadaceae bacterium]|nr:hypothetical protein [Gemmatimonadaceae bacterium]
MSARAARAVKVAGGGVGALALFGFGYIARNWYRYGKVSKNGKTDLLLDRFMPTYEVRERHETRVAAPVAIAYEAVRRMDMNRSRLVRGMFRARAIALRAKPEPLPQLEGFLEQAQSLGWGILAEEPGREIVLGAVTKPWMANVHFERLDPGRFTAFDGPGYVKIAFTMVAEPVDARSSIVKTETRVITTDRYARKRFRRYWTVVSPGVRLIRVEALRLVRADAERRFEAGETLVETAAEEA